MSRPVRVALLAVAILGVALLGNAVPPLDEAPETPSPGSIPVSTATLVCPGTPAADTRTWLSVGSLPEIEPAAVPPESAGPGEAADGGSGVTATLLGTEVGLVELAGRGAVVTRELEPLPDVAYEVSAAGSDAIGVAAQTRSVGAGESAGGLATTLCAAPRPSWWFVAGSGTVGRRASLVLVNPGDSAAVLDVLIHSEDGLMRQASLQDQGLEPGTTTTIDVDGLAAPAERLAVQVRASRGTVVAAMLVREVRGVDPQGLSWVPAAAAPATRQWVAPTPGDGDRTLRVVNVSEQTAAVTVRAILPRGSQTMGVRLSVPPGAVSDASLDEVAGRSASFEVQSTEPVVSTVRQDVVAGLPDMRHAGSSDPLGDVGGMLLAGRSSTRLLAARIDEDPLQVLWQRFDAKGVLIDEGTLELDDRSLVGVDLPPVRRASSLVVRSSRPGAGIVALAETDVSTIPNVTGRGTRPVTKADLVPVPSVTTRVPLVPLDHDVRAGTN